MLRPLIIFYVVFFAQLHAAGITKAPTLIRACMNVADSVVTIDYSSINDACGSFVEHQIYGSEDKIIFNLLKTQKVFGANSIQIKLPNSNPTWVFFFETRFKCNGSDTAKSNVLALDITPPTDNAIDSVSIDFLTQRPIVGWQANTSKDTKGYRVYTQSNGINSTLADTSSLVYMVKYQSVKLPIRYTLAAFDSCNLFSSISSFHTAMILNTSLDTCTKSASLTWTSYVGWASETQAVHISINRSTFSPTPVGANDVSYAHPGVNFGDSVCFFIRATNTVDSKKSSSSNVSCTKLTQPVLPKFTYLSQVTVARKNIIKIESFVDNEGVADSVVLYRVEGSPKRIGSKKLLPGDQFYTWIDNNAFTDNKSNTYFIRTFAPCLGGTSSSLYSNSILLKIDGEYLTWNPYTNWNGLVSEYNILGFDGSTWNIVSNTTDLFYENKDTSMLCFRVEAVENQNTYGFSRVSKSNTVCAKRTPVYYIPNTLNPLSKNHTLKVIGTSIDQGNSKMLVFNRWGEQIFITEDVQTGWSVDATTTFVPMGVYFYDIAIMDLNGNKHRLSGSVRVIR